MSETLKDLLKTSDFDRLEEAWMLRLEEGAKEIEDFVEAAKGLIRAREKDRATYLLELLDEQLESEKRFQDRLRLLRHVGKHYVSAKRLHPILIKTLDHLYEDQSSYQEMSEKLGLFLAKEDVPKLWKKVERLETLLAFDIGTIVRMKGKGAGRVSEVNMVLESFKVDFEEHPSLRVRFHGAAKLLEPIESDHILRRKIEDKESLIKLRDEEPSQLLRLVLESFNEPCSSSDIRRALTGVVAEEKWNSWWNTARKHPQVVVSSKGRHSYTWAATSEDAHSAVWRSFEAGDERKKIDLLRREASRDDELKERMSTTLAKRANAVYQSDPGLAVEIWLGLERHGIVPNDSSWEPQRLLNAPVADLLPLLEGMRDRQWRERAYQILRENHADWAGSFPKIMLQESDPRLLDQLSEQLEAEDPNALDRVLDQLVTQPRKSPGAFVWMAERAADRTEWQTRNPLRLLRQVLRAQIDGALSEYKQRLSTLVESGKTVPRLLQHLTEDQATEAMQALEKATGLADYEREPLINALELKFPHLREEEVHLYATMKSIDAKKAEMRELAEVEIPTNRKAIEEARELGDLRENFEYKSARQRHEYLSARLAALNNDLTQVRPINPKQVTGEEVVIGSTLHLESDTDGSRTLTILGPWESDPEAGVLSNQSDQAKALLGNSVGTVVDLGGTSWRIAKIQPYEEG